MAGAPRVGWDGLLPLAGAVVLFSSAWVVSKQAIAHGAAPAWLAVGRTGLSTLVSLGLLLALRRLRRPGRPDLVFLVSVGLCQLALFFAFVHLALLWVGAGRTSVITSATIVFTVPASVLLLGERVPPWRWLGVAAGVAGLVVLMGPWSIDWRDGDVVLGHLFLLAAAASVGVPMLVVRLAPPVLPMSALLPWAFGLASLLLLPLALVLGPVGVWEAPALGALAFVGGLAGPIGTWCALLAMQRLPVVVGSVGFLLTPAVGLILAALWLGEPIGADLLAGTALILGGVLVAAVAGRGR